MIYEIINPSDPYTLYADDFKVAAASVLLLGQGAYSIENEKGDEEMPIFLSGGADEWIEEKFGDFEKWMDKNRDKVAECLESVMSFGFNQRYAYDEAIKAIKGKKAKQEYRDKIHDKNRSSLNDIGAKAWRIAEKLRSTDKVKNQ